MKIIYNRIIPFKGFSAINLFSLLFARRDATISEKTINHETIHTEQQKEMLWVFFYLWYVIEWLIRVLFTKDRFTKEAYRNISFEREAYKYQGAPGYTKTRKRYAWIHRIAK